MNYMYNGLFDPILGDFFDDSDDYDYDYDSDCYDNSEKEHTVKKSRIYKKSQAFDCTESLWYLLYVHERSGVVNGNEDSLKLFRLRFRVPYSFFINFMMPVAEELLPEKPDIISQVTSLQLKVLAVLRILARAVQFDEVAEMTFISRETLRVFFHKFIKLFVERYFKEYIPGRDITEDAIERNMIEYTTAGFNGCFGSIDCVHIHWDACFAQLKHSFKNGKYSYKTIVFEVCCNNRREIFSCTKGYPGTQSDMTVSEQDETVYAIRTDAKFTQKSFVLKESNGEEIPMKGLYLLSDNGFHKWQMITMPMKNPVSEEQKRWSKWCESMRKDIECTFGILKKRFLILKNPIRLRSIKSITNVFHCCCLLHNMLLSIDGLDEIVDERNGTNINDDLPMPAPFRRILHTDMMLPDERNVHPNELQKKQDKDGGFLQLRSKLITHFDYLFKTKKILWPHKKIIDYFDMIN